MARLKTADKLADLQKKKAQLDAQLRALEARQKDQERKEDTRRKVIAGALALEHFEKNPGSEFATVFGRLLNEYVKRPADRALFASIANEPEAKAAE